MGRDALGCGWGRDQGAEEVLVVETLPLVSIH